MNTLDTDTASELAWSRRDDPDQQIAYKDHVLIDQGRWENYWMVVIQTTDGLYGFDWAEPATEMQEGGEQFPDERNGEVPVYPVAPKTVTTYVKADA